MKRKIVFILSFVVFLVAVQQVSAQTILRNIGSTNQNSTTVQQTQNATLLSASCPTLTRNLWLGLRGTDISSLQTFLRSTGDFTYPELTTFYGNVTATAVKRFQCREMGICSGTDYTTGYGVTGPATRAAIARACASNAQTNPSTGSGQATTQTQTTHASPTATQGTATTALTLSRNLWLGLRGTDVSNLQRFLKTTGDFTYPEITGYYGNVTAQAVQRYQCRTMQICSGTQNSNGYGVVGPKTRASLHSEATTKSVSTYTNNPSTPSYTAPPVPTQFISAYAWEFSNWSICANNVQTRTATCKGLDGKVYANAKCSITKPAEARSCGTIPGQSTGSSLPESAQSCTFNGQAIAHGNTVTTYQSSSVAYGQTCQSQTRTCSNGTLSGSYINTSCSVQGASTCSVAGLTLNHNQSKTLYSTQTVPFGQTCQSQSRICTNGTLSGSSTYSNLSCSVASAQSCTLDGISVRHGSSQTFYSQTSAPYGASCGAYAQQRTCSNGTLSGSSSYNKKACSQQSAQSCTFNGQAVVHGGSVMAYQSATVPYGQSCQSQTRSCSDGSLSGSYTYAACAADEAATIQTQILESGVTDRATFHSNNQNIVSNSFGIFATYLTSYNSSTYDALWKLVRSTDGGATFQTIYTGTSRQNPPVIETDSAGNIYLIHSTPNSNNFTDAQFYRFNASANFANPQQQTIAGGGTGKYTAYFDKTRNRIYYFTHRNAWEGGSPQTNFFTLSTNGAVTESHALTIGGPEAPWGIQYPHLTMDGGVLYIGWTTEVQNSTQSNPFYKSIHAIKSVDGGSTFKTLGGNTLSLPIIAGASGPTNQYVLGDEYGVGTWLAGFESAGGKLHLIYEAVAPLSRQHYMRIQGSSGAREIDINPDLCDSGVCLSTYFHGGSFTVDRRSSSQTLYAVARDRFAQKLHVFVSENQGASWQAHTVGEQIFSSANINQIGSYRNVTSDGYIVGLFTEQNGNNSQVIFFKTLTQ